MEPTPEQLGSFSSVHDVLEWVPFRGPAAEAVLDVLGLEREDPPRVLAVLNREVVL